MKLRVYFQIALHEAVLPSGLGCSPCPQSLGGGRARPVTQTPACCLSHAGRPVPAASSRDRNRAGCRAPGARAGAWTEHCSSHSRARCAPRSRRGGLPRVPRQGVAENGAATRFPGWGHWAWHRHQHGHCTGSLHTLLRLASLGAAQDIWGGEWTCTDREGGIW